ncbi:hypothetical protein B0T14DRAFT_201457 [Immersiella caudata]|uniref:Uncharacterized protein n=1 Tax=Immersiella caudata TaxID=314043 RepID=A0AA39WPG4_9PEZI|nr:hypothetical protein B0T14DRAFT_201457 [Immersiella caudata]
MHPSMQPATLLALHNLQAASCWYITVRASRRKHTSLQNAAEAECSLSNRLPRSGMSDEQADSIPSISPYPSHTPRHPRNTSPEASYRTADSKASKPADPPGTRHMVDDATQDSGPFTTYPILRDLE